MNKRLLLSLYDRSGLGAYMPVDLKGHDLQVEEHIEKFAELIIQACISKIAMIGISNFENDDVSWTVDKAIEDIREHFGVKE